MGGELPPAEGAFAPGHILVAGTGHDRQHIVLLLERVALTFVMRSLASSET